MKVLHILDERWDSGLTAYGLSAAAALRALGHEVQVAARRNSPAARSAAAQGFDVRALGPAGVLGRVLGRGGWDVVNVHTGTGHSRAALFASGRAAALVRTRADARPLRRTWLLRKVYDRTDGVIAVSRGIAAEFQKLYPELEDRLSVVYPGLPVSAFVPEPAGPVRVALVGRLDPVKGHIYFLDAVRSLKPQSSDEQFVITGEEKNTSLAGLKRQAERRGLLGRVRFLGRQAEVAAFMDTCHAGVIASVGSEAVSRVCLEWMSRGRPVVATSVGCLPEFVEDGKTGFLVPPRDPAAMARALSKLLRDPELRQRMGRAAHEAALSRFALERAGRDTERVYEAALRRRRVG